MQRRLIIFDFPSLPPLKSHTINQLACGQFFCIKVTDEIFSQSPHAIAINDDVIMDIKYLLKLFLYLINELDSFPPSRFNLLLFCKTLF